MISFSRGARVPTQQRFRHLYFFAAFAERRRGVGTNGKFLFTRAPAARAEPKVLRGAARRPPRRFARCARRQRFARYASLTAGAGAWRRRCAKKYFREASQSTLPSLKSLCGGGVPSSHPSLGLSVSFLSF